MQISDKSKTNLIRLAILLGIILAVYLIFRLTPLSLSDFTPTKVKDFILQFGIWGPIIFILIYALRAVVLVIPVGVMSLAGGLAYGKWVGTVYILIGATLGACLSFALARSLGRKFIEQFRWLHKGRIKTFDESSEKYGFRLILFIRLVPLFQYDAVNFGAGLSKMRFRDFAIGSFIGMIPGGFVNALLGSSLTNVLSAQFFIAIGLFIMLMFIPAIYKFIKKRRGQKPDLPGMDSRPEKK